MAGVPTCALLCFLLVLGIHRAESRTQTTGEITGQVFAPSLATTRVYLHMSTGETRMAYLAPDSSFTFKDVPLGMHLIQPFHLAAYFPEFQVELGKNGVFRAQIIAMGSQQQSIVQAIDIPLKLRPLSDMQYYERRKPVDVWSFVKSPYGLMIAFSLFVIVVLPRLKVDPEDMKDMQAQIRGEAAPARLAGGGGNTNTRR